MLPSYITHYHLPDRVPFLSLSGLDVHRLEAVLAEMKEKHHRGQLRRIFTRDYVVERKKTEIHVRNEFIKKGGIAPKGISTLFRAWR